MPSSASDELLATVTRAKEVNDAVLIFVGGVQPAIDAAVAKALELGATAAQLEQIKAVGLAFSAEAVFQAINAGIPPANQLKRK